MKQTQTAPQWTLEAPRQGDSAAQWRYIMLSEAAYRAALPHELELLRLVEKLQNPRAAEAIMGIVHAMGSAIASMAGSMGEAMREVSAVPEDPDHRDAHLARLATVAETIDQWTDSPTYGPDPLGDDPFQGVLENVWNPYDVVRNLDGLRTMQAERDELSGRIFDAQYPGA